MNSFVKDDKQGEPSFVIKLYTSDKKEWTDETISTWLGHWESHSKLYLKPNNFEIVYASHDLGGKVVAWWCGLHNAQKLPTVGDDFVDIFKKQFLQPPSKTETTKNLLTLLVGNFIHLKTMFILLGPN